MGSISKRKMKDVKGNRYVLFQAEIKMKGQRYSRSFQFMREAKAYISEQEGLINRGFLSGVATKVKVKEAIRRYLKEVSIMKSSHRNEEAKVFTFFSIYARS